MRMSRNQTRRRLTAVVAATLGAGLLATTAGTTAADAAGTVRARTYSVDPQILGDEVPSSFVTATFNVLGGSHTTGDPSRSGTVRMGYTVQLLQGNRVDLVGLQELETKQATAFKQLAGTTYQLYSPPRDTRDSIAWRRSRFDLVRADGVRVPYKLHWRTMPIVELRDKVTGQQFRVLSVHNVAGKESVFVKRRAISVRLETEKIRALQATRPMPTFVMGDFNDRTQAFYCQMLGNQLFSSSVWWTTPVCSLPSRPQIDWIFGSSEVRFTGYVRQDGGLVDLASDHPLILARASR